jgi:hypothetical protein
MEAMTTSNKLLAQDDVDAILNQAGLEGDYEEGGLKESASEEKRTPRPKRKSDEDVHAITAGLFNKAFLERDEDVCVIWNAAGVMPMEPGTAMRIQGIDCTALGSLHDRHLVIRYDNT